MPWPCNVNGRPVKFGKRRKPLLPFVFVLLAAFTPFGGELTLLRLG
jgi:hypothetical protein